MIRHSMFYILLFGFFIIKAFSQEGWTEVNLPIMDSSLFCISFSDSLHGCMAGRNGRYLYTNNGGFTWTAKLIPTTSKIRLCKIVSANVAWAFAANDSFSTQQRAIFRTTNAGDTWFSKTFPESVEVGGVSFISTNSVRFTSKTHLYSTIDEGTTWQVKATLAGPVLLPSLEFYNDSIGFIGGGWGTIPGTAQKTTDGGLTWKKMYGILDDSTSSGFIKPVNLIDGRLGCFLGYQVDGITFFQLSWMSSKIYGYAWWWPFFLDPIPFKSGFALETYIWCLLKLDGVIYRKNGWDTEREDTLPVPIDEILYDTYGHKFALGSGRLFKLNLSTVVEFQEIKAHPNEFVLKQNYPNPFNPTTMISFNLPSRSFVSLKVFDLLGREIATIISEEMPAGNYSKQWNAVNVSSGIYFYRLQAGSFLETKKLVLLR